MPLPRALPLLAGLVSLGPTACATQAVEPPHGPACIERYKPFRHAHTRYFIEGKAATSEEVESLVDAMPGMQEKRRRNRTMLAVGGSLLGTGVATEVSGFAASMATNRPALLAIVGGGLVTAVTGFIVLAKSGDPFYDGITAFNEQARRRGWCLSPDRPFPPPPPPPASWTNPLPYVPPAEDLPQLPSRGWKP